MDSFQLREISPTDKAEVSELIYASINVWYMAHGMGQPFKGGPQITEVFYDVYFGIGTSRCVVAENTRSGRLMGSCYYHPRKTHVALGIMNVHPNYFGCGVGSGLLKYVCDFTDRAGYKQLRLTQSGLNLDSYSLYTRHGFVPRQAYQDMYLRVPAGGLKHRVPGMDNIRDARLEDVREMVALEMEIGGVSREEDLRFCIENKPGFFHGSVYESPDGTIEGFVFSSGHPAFNMLGPGVIRNEDVAAALFLRELEQHRGKSPIFLVANNRVKLVRMAYDWGARNCELHFGQVRGECQPYQGINVPTFVMETA